VLPNPEFPDSFFTRRFETRSLPSSLVATPRDFAFYVADPISSIETRSFPGAELLETRVFAQRVPERI
jgi:hypothetical protein